MENFKYQEGMVQVRIQAQTSYQIKRAIEALEKERGFLLMSRSGVVTEYLPITDIEATILSVRLVQRRINRKLKIEGILLTKVKSRTILAREAEEAVRDAYEKNIRIFDSKIPLSTRVAETPALGISIYRYDPHGKAAEAYESLTREVLANE